MRWKLLDRRARANASAAPVPKHRDIELDELDDFDDLDGRGRFPDPDAAPTLAEALEISAAAGAADEAAAPEREAWDQPQPASQQPAAQPAGGLRAVTRPLDRWFGIEATRLERRARAHAASWARAGMPRQDAPAAELDVETHLQTLAASLFSEWVQKVATRVRDATEREAQRARNAIAALGFHHAELRRAVRRVAKLDGDVASLTAAGRPPEASFGYRRYFSRFWYIAAIALLVIVDWVANVPVFGELLPQDAVTAAQWRETASSAERYGILAGVVRLGHRIMLWPEVAIFALGVIIFLVLLGHFAGDSFRRLVSVHEDEVPDAVRSVRAHHREFILPAALSTLGGLTVVLFLFVSRDQIATSAMQRYEAAEQQVAAIETQWTAATQAQDMEAIARIGPQRAAAEANAAALRERRDYAERIAAVNMPIALLNLVLFLTAILGAYLTMRGTVVATDPEDPRLRGLRERSDEARSTVAARRDAIAATRAEVQTALAATEYLGNVDPYSGWESRRDRLAGLVPLFRAENARLRGVDPQNIAAFRTERPFEVETPSLELPRTPPDFPELENRKRQLDEEWSRIDEESREIA